MRPPIEACRRSESSPYAGGIDPAAVRSLDGVHLSAPIRDPWNLMAIAANYRSHADEMGVGQAIDPDAEEPVFFAKSPRNCIADPGQPFAIPPGRNIDWEGELALVIGRDASDVGLETAADHIRLHGRVRRQNRGGALPDERDVPAATGPEQEPGRRCAFGLVTVPRRFIADPWHSGSSPANGEVRQDGDTSRLIYDEAHIIRSLSSVMTLRRRRRPDRDTGRRRGGPTPPVFLDRRHRVDHDRRDRDA
jgi:2-keto-4-pentenoate hydratase/2-oxohepta-3-ene-1,7-dioic acid hydratase in catechol pathway